MLETLLHLIISTFLSSFISLPRSSLQLSLWSGSCTFANVKIQEKVLKALGVGFGEVGKVEVRIPWRDLFRRKVEIIISGVYIAPHGSKSCFEGVGDGAAEDGKVWEGGEGSSGSYLSTVLATIMHNVTITVRDVRVEYGCMGKGLIGVEVGVISAFTANKRGQETFYDPFGSGEYFKMVEIGKVKAYVKDEGETQVLTSFEAMLKCKREAAMEGQDVWSPVSALGSGGRFEAI